MHKLIPVKTGNAAHWQIELANAISSVEELVDELELGHLRNDLVHTPGFRLRVPRAFVRKMQKGNADDPLLKQVLPVHAETASSGLADPVGDLDAMTVPGLLHKYQGRVLLVTTGACAIHCRYCFRRHFPYTSANPSRNEWKQALAYLRAHEDINEVVLSGGDPLVLDNAKLHSLLSALEDIPHIQWLRLHTRLPVVLPSRIDHGLLDILQGLRFTKTVVIHANHANEITPEESESLKRLAASGCTLLNQSVLLKGINDSPTSLLDLSTRLYQSGVLPYYLHMLDPVRGALHFEVSQRRAVEILNTVRASLPGFLVPRLVREIPGEVSKTAIFTI
jgi:EF-P beta-lysylation protein EpmB